MFNVSASVADPHELLVNQRLKPVSKLYLWLSVSLLSKPGEEVIPSRRMNLEIL